MALHIPVMVAEVLEAVDAAHAAHLVDMTLGGGGHAKAMLQVAPAGATLIAIDRDETAIEMARPALAQFESRVAYFHSRFSRLPEILAEAGLEHVDGVLLDAGVSRDQIIDPERGFSFTSEAHLDMRQSRSEPLTAYTVVNDYDPADLGAVMSRTGKVREARRVAARVVAARKTQPITTTAQLAEIIAAAVARPGDRGKHRHPSTEWLMAIRVEVNDEVNELIKGIEAGVRALEPETGRFVVLTWNGLEHRIARRTLRALINPCRCLPTLPCNCGLKPLAKWLVKGASPTEDEVARNPSARSCRLFAVTAA
jgi:16S rRNA (cytosine1402-N4)-methyltransferase